MGVYYTPRIVTDNLIFYLDAGNSKSYPGTGTVWYDISKQNRNGTLYNSPVYSTENKGTLRFVGTNVYAALNTVLPQNNMTLSFWLSGNSGLDMIFWQSELQFTSTSRRWYNNDTFTNTSSYSIPLGRFVFVTWVIDITNKKDQVYINGALANTSTIPASATLITGFNGDVLGPAQLLSDEGVAANSGVLGSALGYSRALTQTEILQNFNATKGWYGL